METILTLKNPKKVTADDVPRNITGHVVIPDGVEIVEEDAFHDCALMTSLDVPPSVQPVEKTAFEGCTSLTKINLPPSLANRFYKRKRKGVKKELCKVRTSVTLRQDVVERIKQFQEDYNARSFSAAVDLLVEQHQAKSYNFVENEEKSTICLTLKEENLAFLKEFSEKKGFGTGASRAIEYLMEKTPVSTDEKHK